MERVQLYMKILNPTKSNFTPCFRLYRFRLQGEAFAIGWCVTCVDHFFGHHVCICRCVSLISDGWFSRFFRIMLQSSNIDENCLLSNPRSALGSVSASIMAASASEPARKAVPRQLDFTSAYGGPLPSSESPHRPSQPSM